MQKPKREKFKWTTFNRGFSKSLFLIYAAVELKTYKQVFTYSVIFMVGLGMKLKLHSPFKTTLTFIGFLKRESQPPL